MSNPWPEAWIWPTTLVCMAHLNYTRLWLFCINVYNVRCCSQVPHLPQCRRLSLPIVISLMTSHIFSFGRRPPVNHITAISVFSSFIHPSIYPDYSHLWSVSLPVSLHLENAVSTSCCCLLNAALLGDRQYFCIFCVLHITRQTVASWVITAVCAWDPASVSYWLHPSLCAGCLWSLSSAWPSDAAGQSSEFRMYLLGTFKREVFYFYLTH